MRLGQFLTRVERALPVVETQVYRFLGVRSFGGGSFDAGEKLGTETRYSTLNTVAAGDLVYPKLMAWEGAFARVPPSFDGWVVSPEFCTFVVDTSVADPLYVEYYFRRPETWEVVAGQSIGTNLRRRRLYPDDFLEKEIDLPDLAEQQRIISRLEALLGAASSVVERCEKAARLDRVLVDSILDGIVADSSRRGWPEAPLDEVATVNPPPLRVEGLVAFVPMSAVDDRLGEIVNPEIRPVADVKSGYKQFRRGDVIFARITPCMQNGKSAVMDVDGVEYGLGSTEFHVLRPSGEVLAEWLHHVVRSRGFRERATKAFSGTAGQQRVPADFLRAACVPVPPIKVQRELVIQLDRVAGLGNELRRRREHQLSRARALAHSILNRAFAGAPEGAPPIGPSDDYVIEKPKSDRHGSAPELG